MRAGARHGRPLARRRHLRAWTASDDSVFTQGSDLGGGHAQQARQHLVGVAAERGAGVVHAADEPLPPGTVVSAKSTLAKLGT